MQSSLWHLLTSLVCIGFVVIISVASAGEIAGMRSQLPPTTDPDVAINFSNDFFGRGGAVDDFRTTQLILSGRIGDRWLAVLDHSTLTLDDSLLAGRIDQLTGSLGYRFVDQKISDRVTRITAGTGFRSVGDFFGERMQNGFHRIVGSDIEELPYIDSSGTDATLWIDADHYAEFHTSTGSGFFGGWRSGYWLRASSLATSDAQWDGALGAYAVSSKNAVDVWLGARRDWRSGYDQDFVQRATANAEDDLAIVFGLRIGALVIETVQQLNEEGSYGQIKLVADGRQPFPSGGVWPRFDIEFGFILPDVQVQIAGKYRSRLLVSPQSNWRESVLVDVRYGEPQFEDNSNSYVRSQQLSVGMEWERQLAAPLNWISGYGSVGLGWRSEKLLGDGQLNGQSSESVGRATAVFGGGLRFAAAALGLGWHYRLQLGLTGWIPASSTDVQFAGQTLRLQEAGLGISLGMTFDYK